MKYWLIITSVFSIWMFAIIYFLLPPGWSYWQGYIAFAGGLSVMLVPICMIDALRHEGFQNDWRAVFLYWGTMSATAITGGWFFIGLGLWTRNSDNPLI